MPKTTFLEPNKNHTKQSNAKRHLTDEICRLYGMNLTLADVTAVLGKKDPKAAKHWIEAEGLEATEINKRRHWLATDVARALENSKIRGT